MDELEAQVFRSIESGRDRMVRFLQDLIRIDTQVPPGHDYDKVCEVIEDKYRRLGYSTFLYDAPEKYMILSGARHIGLEAQGGTSLPDLEASAKDPRFILVPTQTQPPYRSRVELRSPRWRTHKYQQIRQERLRQGRGLHLGQRCRRRQG